MKLKRNYLTSAEIALVAESMLSVDTEYERQILRYGLIGQLLIDELNVDEISNNKVYDTLLENAIDIDKDVSNINVVDKIVNRELSSSKIIEKTINGIVENIDKSMESLDFKSLLVELEKLQDKTV